MNEQPKKILIIGGGCAALTTAFALSDSPELRKRFKIRVLQPGWRLGGKGASGRNLDRGHRIEEHGLHVWSGFYENAFWLMRRCYKELARDRASPLASTFDAFVEHHEAGMGFAQGSGWGIWHGSVPHEQGLPGDAIATDQYAIVESTRSPWDLMQSLLLWSLRYTQSNQQVQANINVDGQHSGGWLLQILYRLTDWPAGGWWARILHVLKIVVFLWHAFRAWLSMSRLNKSIAQAGGTASPEIAERCQDLADRLVPIQERVRELARTSSEDQDLHRMVRLAELVTSLMIGLLRHEVPVKGFDCLDDFDLREWLALHGASSGALDEPTIEALYCYVFAYEQGKPEKPRLAAGVSVRMMFRLLLGCRGALFWRMQAGMGDTVFAPLYQALKQRGVEFEFFSSVTDIRTDDGLVCEVQVEQSATIIDHKAYEPLIDVKGLPCWPDRPLYDQLNEGAQLRQHFLHQKCDIDTRLSDWAPVSQFIYRRGVDFDEVVCAASVSAIPVLAPSLMRQHPDFAESILAQSSVRTQSSQIWLDKDSEDLGWRHAPTVVTGLPKPFDTWADLSTTLKSESPDPMRPGPRSVHYFCAVLPDDEPGCPPVTTQAQADSLVTDNMWSWLNRHSSWVLPNLLPITKHSSPFHAFEQRLDDRFGQQWFTGNIDLSSRYVLSLPGSTKKRPQACVKSVRNLYLAGDWVQTGLNYGCVESAVIGGLKAARAIGGYPSHIHGEQDLNGERR